jgi:dCTP deaminase
MILTGAEIQKNVDASKITIDPFRASNVTTNSYDLHLGNELIFYTDPVLDTKKPANFEKIIIPENGKLLPQGSFHLGATKETVGSDHFVPILHNRSSIARKGLFVHITADLIDIGYVGNFTLQLYATLPIKIYPGMCIAQVTFWVPIGDIVLYNGKYMRSVGPRPSDIYKDPMNDEDQNT